MPLDIHAKELGRLYGAIGVVPSQIQKTDERSRSIREWQRRWETQENGRWTYALIPSIEAWITRPHGELDYFLTQILSGHGCFQQYLHRFKIADSPFCPDCPKTLETAEHVIFECDRFVQERNALERVFGCRPTVANFTGEMISSRAKWNAGQLFAGQIVRRLHMIERDRRVLQ